MSKKYDRKSKRKKERNKERKKNKQLRRVKAVEKLVIYRYPYYLYKRDSNKSKRTCILIHNYLEDKTRKRKENVLIS